MMIDIEYTSKCDRVKVYKYGTDVFKSENISIYFAVPTEKEKNVSRSLLLSVLKRGTESFPSQRQINERLDELYATLVNLKNQKYDGVQLLGISADAIKQDYTNGEDILSQALDVMGEMLLKPLLDERTGLLCEEYVSSEKENYKSIILSQINEPRTYAAIRCREEMFSSLGLIDTLDGMCERIDEQTAESLTEAYREILESLEIVVFYVGERSASEIADRVEAMLPSLDSVAPLPGKTQRAALLENREEPVEIIESHDSSQSRLVMGYNCRVTWHDEDYYAMLLCNEILGASPVSKLFMNVREALSLCYECSSVYNSARGALFVTTGIDSENYALALSAIKEQVEDIKKGKFTDAELSAAKKSVANVYAAVYDSPSAIERFYLGRIINGIDMDVAGFLEKISALAREDVVRAAEKLSLHTVYLLRGEGMDEEADRE